MKLSRYSDLLVEVSGYSVNHITHRSAGESPPLRQQQDYANRCFINPENQIYTTDNRAALLELKILVSHRSVRND